MHLPWRHPNSAAVPCIERGSARAAVLCTDSGSAFYSVPEQTRIQDRRSGGGHIAEDRHFHRGDAVFAQVGAKSYRGAPINASWGGGGGRF